MLGDKPLKHYKKTTIFFIITICVLALLVPSRVQSQTKKNILFLNSYHEGYPWSDNIIKGVSSVLEKEKINVHTEYMDTKRTYDDRHFQNLFELYLHKFSEKDFDLIITSDDNAFQFLLQNRSVLFPFVPIVFCGVGNFKESMLTGHKNITGVTEDIDIKSTIDIALKLHPKTKKVYVISDQVVSGKVNVEKVKKIIPDYQESLQFILWDNLEAGELKKKLKELPQDSIALFISFSKDRSGKFFSIEEQLMLITQNSKVPVYTCWASRIQHGMTGGMAVSGFYQGETAGKMALKILKGEDADNIPVLKESPNKYMFDYKQLKRFKIKLSTLPEGSIVINQPSTFYSVHKGILRMISIVRVILVLSVIMLLFNNEKRREAEEALKHERDFAESIVQTAQAVVLLLDTEGRIIRFNNYMEEISGYRLEEVRGKKWFETFIPESHRNKIDKMFLKAISGAKTRANVNSILTKDGQKIEIEWFDKTLKDMKGNVIGLLAIGQDITERRRVEEAVRESEERYRSLFEDSPNSLWEEDFSAVKTYFEKLKASGITDLKRYLADHPEELQKCAGMVKVLDINKATVELLKFSREELMRDLLKIFREESYTVFLEELVALSEGKTIFESEAVNRTKDGKELYVTLRLAVVSGYEDTWSKVLVSITNITDRKHTEDQLKSLYDLGKKVTSIISKDELLPWIAEQAAELLDTDECVYRIREGDYLVRGGGTLEVMEIMSREKIKMGESVSGVVAERKKPIIISDIREDERHIEEHKKAAKKFGYISFLGVPMMIGDEVRGVLSVLTKKPREFNASDVELLSSFADMAAIAIENARLFEDLQDARKELEEWSKKLSKKVTERTKELKEVHGQLLHSERLAATGRLGAGIAHEINNPLQAIDNFVNIVMGNLEKKSEDYEYLKLASEGIGRIASIVKQLSSFYRPDKETKMESDINSIIEKSLALIQNQLTIKKIKAVKKLTENLPKVTVSPRQIQQVLINLILNAQDAMPDGGRLMINTGTDQDAVYVKVKDTGIGISEQDIRHVFEPFYSSKKRQGTGLGLSVSYGIIREHGGDIFVESKEKEGTTFTIKLPVEKK